MIYASRFRRGDISLIDSVNRIRCRCMRRNGDGSCNWTLSRPHEVARGSRLFPPNEPEDRPDAMAWRPICCAVQQVVRKFGGVDMIAVARHVQTDVQLLVGEKVVWWLGWIQAVQRQGGRETFWLRVSVFWDEGDR